MTTGQMLDVESLNHMEKKSVLYIIMDFLQAPEEERKLLLVEGTELNLYLDTVDKLLFINNGYIFPVDLVSAFINRLAILDGIEHGRVLEIIGVKKLVKLTCYALHTLR